MQRRHLFAALGRSAAALALARTFAPLPARASAMPWPASAGQPFTLGVASGMPRPDSVVIWTRLAPLPHEPLGGAPDRPVTVRWEFAEDERFARGLRSGEFETRPQRGHAVHVEVDRLQPGRFYYYRFHAGAASSPVGRTRTAPHPADAPARLRFALASCQHYEQGWYAAHREIAARDLDVVLFVGDYLYESSNPRYRLRAHERPTAPFDLEGYRARHATYKLDPDLRAAHAAHPWILTWDDHEVVNDYAGEHGGSARYAERFLERRAAAYQAYFEHMPLSPDRAPQGPAMQLQDRFVWGRLAELWTLDGRQHKDLQACNDDGLAGGRLLVDCAELAAPGRSLLGFAQERWLADGLGASQRAWKLVAQGTQMSASGIDTPLGRQVYSDGWDGYPAARERLLRGIAERGLRDVLVLGGDVHRHVAANLRLRPNDERSPVVASEFVCSSVTSRGLSEAGMAMVRRSNPDLVHTRGDERGYALVEIDADGARCDFRATPFPSQPGARLGSQAQVLVERGRAGVTVASRA